MLNPLKVSVKGILLLLLFLPVKIFAQCPEWIGSTIEKAEILKPLIQKHFTIAAKESSDTLTSKIYSTKTYKDEHGSFFFKIGWYVKKSIQEGKEVTLTPVVNDIAIQGEADKIDQLFKDLNEFAKSCSAYSAGDQWIKFSKFIMIVSRTKSTEEINMKTITIKPFSNYK